MDNELVLVNELTPAKEFAIDLLVTAGHCIVTAENHAAVIDTLKDVKSRFNALDKREKEITRPMLDSLASVRDLFRIPKNLLTQAEKAFKDSVLSYQRAEAEKQSQAQRIAQEQAEKERNRLAKLAAAAEQRGAADEAAQFAERAAAVVAPIVQSQTVKVAGVSMRHDWTFEITDIALIPREYMLPDEVKIRRVVRALGQDANILGVRAIELETLAVGGLK